MTHVTRNRILQRQVRVALIGAGGAGSQMLTGLAQLNHAITSLGHPGGLDVTVWDDDLVSESNIGRQMFSPADVGQPKSAVLVHRVNAFMGLDWEAKTERYGNHTRSIGYQATPDLIIGCVDTRASRLAILENGAGSYWLDLGNTLAQGQTVIGEIGHIRGPHDKSRLPNVADLLPEIVDASRDSEDDHTPSCSLAEALEKQSLFVNRTVVTHALNLLWDLFRKGRLTYHGVFFNTETGRSNPIAVDPETWKRFGYSAATGKRLKPKKGRA